MPWWKAIAVVDGPPADAHRRLAGGRSHVRWSLSRTTPGTGALVVSLGDLYPLTVAVVVRFLEQAAPRAGCFAGTAAIRVGILWISAGRRGLPVAAASPRRARRALTPPRRPRRRLFLDDVASGKTSGFSASCPSGFAEQHPAYRILDRYASALVLTVLADQAPITRVSPRHEPM
jgi:hypothetical protein